MLADEIRVGARAGIVRGQPVSDGPLEHRVPVRVKASVATERGVALVLALMSMLFIAVLGGALVFSTTIETRISTSFRLRLEALYAADAALERSLADLAGMTDWDAVLSGSAISPFNDGAPGPRVMADDATVNLNRVLASANCQRVVCPPAEYSAVTSDRPWGMNNPRWQLFSHGRLDEMSPSRIESPFYVVVMVADDQSETDGEPLKDGADETNPGAGILVLRAEAFGPFGVRRVVELTVERTIARDLRGRLPAPALGEVVGRASVRILSWRDLS